jgi:Ca2+ insensitive EF hand
MDLRHSLIPDDLIEDLLHSMPKHNGPDLEVDRQVPKYDYIGFMQKMAGGDTSENDRDRTGKAGGVNASPRKENLRPVGNELLTHA